MNGTEDKSVSLAKDRLTDFLKQKRLRRTPERYAILEMVFSHNDHFQVDTIFSEMEANSYHVSRSTVYNTIELFCQCGLVRKHQFGMRQSLYETNLDESSHHHLVCTICGKIREVKDPELMSMINTRGYGKFSVSYSSLCVFGICASCLRKKKKTKSNKSKIINSK